MHRTNVYLDSEVVRSLKLLAAARGKSMSDLIREAVDDMLAHPPDGVDWRSEVAGILDRAGRDLPDLDEDAIAAEVSATRRERTSPAA